MKSESLILKIVNQSLCSQVSEYCSSFLSWILINIVSEGISFEKHVQKIVWLQARIYFTEDPLLLTYVTTLLQSFPRKITRNDFSIEKNRVLRTLKNLNPNGRIAYLRAIVCFFFFFLTEFFYVYLSNSRIVYRGISSNRVSEESIF